MDERESILTFLQSVLWDVPGVKVVTRRDHRSVIGSLQEYPVICIVDGGDEVVGLDSRRNPTRYLYVSFQVVYSGTTEDDAPSELAEFCRLVKKQLYGTYRQCPDIRDFKPQTVSPLNPLKVGSKVVHQYLDFEITYIEDVRRLFADVQPTE